MRTEQEIRDELRATAALASDYHRNNNRYGEQIAQDKLKTLEWMLNDSAKRKEPAPLPENRSNTIDSNHQYWVKQLKAQGVTVLMPKGEPSGTIYGYLMTDKPPKRAGAIFQDKDGTFGLFGDMGALHITGLKWDELGLCDAKCGYEWMDEKRKEKI